MCDKSYDSREACDVIYNSTRELGVISDMLRCSESDADGMTSIHPGDLGILLAGVCDRLTTACMVLEDSAIAALQASTPPGGAR